MKFNYVRDHVLSVLLKVPFMRLFDKSVLYDVLEQFTSIEK